VTRLLILALLLIASAGARAQDSVHVVFTSGGAIATFEDADIRVTGASYRQLDVKPSMEQYFDAVRKALLRGESKGVWEQPPALHADTVKVTINLDGRDYTFSTSYGQKGPEVPIGASAHDLKQLETLKQIIALTMAHLSTRLESGRGN
jgi:hypothetical protein